MPTGDQSDSALYNRRGTAKTPWAQWCTGVSGLPTAVKPVRRGLRLRGRGRRSTYRHPSGRPPANRLRSYYWAFHAVETETVGPIVYPPAPLGVAVCTTQTGRLRSIPLSTTGPVYVSPQ